MCGGEETIVSSMEEVRAYARSIVEEWDFDYLKDTIDAPISEGEIREIIEKLSSAIIASAVEKAERAAEYEGYFA
jgi:6-pyruvoyl-tetrahydropterin synthase